MEVSATTTFYTDGKYNLKRGHYKQGLSEETQKLLFLH